MNAQIPHRTSGTPADAWRTKLAGGLLVDLVDFLVRGAFGLRIGFPLGAAVGLGTAWKLGWRGWRDARMWKLVLACGIYCTVPGTWVVPVGTAASFLALAIDLVERVRLARSSTAAAAAPPNGVA